MRQSKATKIAVTWQDVLAPGVPGSSERPDPFVCLSAAAGSTEAFSLDSARALAAHSLLIYRNSEGRQSVLNKHGLKESFCRDTAESVYSIVEPFTGDSKNRPAIVVFRGTAHFKNWLTNLQSMPKPWSGGGYVHGGFVDAHEEIWKQLSPLLSLILSAGRPVFITGHSLGAALATLTLSRILHDHGDSAKVCAYTFGSPRVGNGEFARSLESARLFRIVNHDDLVTRLPLPFKPSRRLSFLHAGDAYFLDADLHLQSRGQKDLPEESPNLKDFTEHLMNIPTAFAESRPPEFLADHAPIRYVHGLRLNLEAETEPLMDTNRH